MVQSEDMRGGRRAGDAPGPGAAWRLFARVDLPPPRGRHPLLDGVLHQILRRHPVRPPPRQRSVARPFSQAHPESHVVLHERAHKRMQRGKCGILAKDQSHPMLDWFVRIRAHRTDSMVEISHGQREAQRSPAGLL
jgi:hypothetical protein